MKPSNQDFIDLLNKYMRIHDRNNVWVAEKANVTPTTVGRWLNHENLPDKVVSLIRLSDAFLLNKDQCDEFLVAAQKSRLEDAQDLIADDDVITQEALKNIKSRNNSMSHDVFNDGEQTDNFLIPVRRKDREEFRKRMKEMGYIVIEMTLTVLAIVVVIYGIWNILPPDAKETVRRIFNFPPQPTPTPLIEPIPPPTELVPTVIFTPTATLVPTLDPFRITPVAIPSAGLNIRRGPGTDYEVIQTASSGERLLLIGKNPEGTWWNVEFNGVSGWVFGDLVAVQNSYGVPIITNYPPPPATSTPEPTYVTATPLPPTEAPTPSPTETVGQQNAVPALGTQALASFTKISLSAPGNLLLVQDEASSITIDAPEDMLSTIYVGVEGSTLVIGTNSSVQIANASIQYRVSTPNIDTITTSRTGNIRTDNLNADILNLTSDGTGSIEIGALNARVVFIKITGTGDIGVSAGEIIEQNVRIDSTGDFSAGNLKSDKAIIYIGGTGDATVWVNAQLEATITGSGTISYYGSPAVSQNIAELGEIESLGPK